MVCGHAAGVETQLSVQLHLFCHLSGGIKGIYETCAYAMRYSSGDGQFRRILTLANLKYQGVSSAVSWQSFSWLRQLPVARLHAHKRRLAGEPLNSANTIRILVNKRLIFILPHNFLLFSSLYKCTHPSLDSPINTPTSTRLLPFILHHTQLQQHPPTLNTSNDNIILQLAFFIYFLFSPLLFLLYILLSLPFATALITAFLSHPCLPAYKSTGACHNLPMHLLHHPI